MRRYFNKVDIIVVKVIAAMALSEWFWTNSCVWDDVGPTVIMFGCFLSIVVDLVSWLKANFTRRKD